MKQKIFAQTDNHVSERERNNAEISYRAALEGIVLLRNNAALPLVPGKIALFGAGATKTVKGGTGSGEVNERKVISIYDGLNAAGFTISSQLWLNDLENEKPVKKKGDILSSADVPVGRVVTKQDITGSDTDTGIYVVARQAGEGADKRLEKGEFALNPVETESIELMVAAYRKTILIINSGSYMDIGDLDEKVSAVIYICQLGMEGGRALADVLTGKVSPSGHLTDSWATHYDDIPFGMEYSYLNKNTKQEYYKEGIYVGYRYFDSFGVKPRYPFGYGLSYTQFSMRAATPFADGAGFSVNVVVQNVGACAGKAVAQLYATLPEGKLDKERRRLVAFAKTDTLAAGGQQIITLRFALRDLASYSEDQHAWIAEGGEYVLMLGENIADAVAFAALSLDGDMLISQNKAICPIKKKFEVLKNPRKYSIITTEGLPTLKLSASNYETEWPTYGVVYKTNNQKAKEIVAKLSDDEKIKLCVGSGLSGMTCTRYLYTPGTVGRTTDALIGKGLINVNLSDGPAGLRLLQESGLTKRGKQKFVPGHYTLSFMALLPAFILKPMSVHKKDAIYYQYTTSFPVATALTQSWNVPLMEEIGAAVSSEMSEYGITYWLAPAMNLHKNPLCGRNFEYMSEDPLLAGKMAAGLVRGVQSIPGNYATIKHFACNNVEDNRNHSSSNVTEKPLRELYLRSFEIAVREGGAKAVMTSYNKINGVYTPNSEDLCTTVLRDEWGFDGVVMTDWFSTGGSKAVAGRAIAVGNDMIMPGAGGDARSIRKYLKKGKLSEEQLTIAAERIATSILESDVAKRVSPDDFA